MIFVVTVTWAVDKRNEIQERFKRDGGVPPTSVKMLGRWSYVEGGGGVIIAETDDVIGLGKWIQGYSDLGSFQIRPAVTDQDALTVIS